MKIQKKIKFNKTKLIRRLYFLKKFIIKNFMFIYNFIKYLIIYKNFYHLLNHVNRKIKYIQVFLFL